MTITEKCALKYGAEIQIGSRMTPKYEAAYHNAST